MTTQPWADLITRETLAELHAMSIKLHGGNDSLSQKEGCVDGALGNAWTAECYCDQPHLKGGLWFAAHLLFYLARDHCFTDGNKRAAWLAAVEVLRVLGLTLQSSDDDAEALCEDVIARKIDSALGVVSWMGSRLIAA
jgi:death on curing protein